jgi:hypothetical protein
VDSVVRHQPVDGAETDDCNLFFAQEDERLSKEYDSIAAINSHRGPRGIYEQHAGSR